MNNTARILNNRQVSSYTSSNQEDDRLSLQNQMLDTFDSSVYEEAFHAVNSPLIVLDVGCGTGDMIIPKLKEYEVKHFLGIDRSDLQIQKARMKYGSNRYDFECMDIEAYDFATRLRQAMDSHKIYKFNIINISMVLLHLADPQRLLNILHSILSDHGQIIIRDIDDGLNFAYPDTDGFFNRLYQIASQDSFAGDRYTGSKIYSYLAKEHYTDIKLKKQGLSTAGLNEMQKDAFYKMSFQLIIERNKSLSHEDFFYKDRMYNAKWLCKNENAIHEQFMKEDFIASLGFMTYVAGK